MRSRDRTIKQYLIEYLSQVALHLIPRNEPTDYA